MDIQNTNDLIIGAEQLDTCSEQKLFYGDKYTTTESYKAIYNNNQGCLAQVVSSRYQIIQHHHIMDGLVRALKNKGIEVLGRLDNNGNQFRCDLVFTNKGAPVKDDSDKGIQLGMRVMNSYNRSSSFRMEMYGFRMVCQNGMSLGSVMNNVKEVVFHTGQEKNLELVQGLVESFIDKVIDSSSQLQTYVSNCIVDSIAWDEVTKILEKYLPHQKHRDKICEKLGITMIKVVDEKTKKRSFKYVLEKGGKSVVNRWDMYNVLTDYASHNKLSFGTENFIQGIAQTTLKNKFNDLKVVEKTMEVEAV